MRKYRVHYWKIINDEDVDCEIEIKARHIVEVFGEFQEQVRVFKRVTKIEEI
jgi:hypothetical protein